MTEVQQKRAWELACVLYDIAHEYNVENEEGNEELDTADALCTLLYKPEYNQETKDD